MAQAIVLGQTGGGAYATLPAQVTNFRAQEKNAAIQLNWDNPTSDFAGLYITRKIGSAPTKVNDGVRIDCKTATSYLDSGLQNKTMYYYRAFPYNSKKQAQTIQANAVVNVRPIDGIALYSLPVGTLVVDPNTRYNNKPIIWKIAYSPSPPITQYSSTMLITERIIAIKCFDSREPNNTIYARTQYGNSRYLYSNIRIWLNSNEGEGAWYSAQHSADTPPETPNTTANPYYKEAGLASMLSSNFHRVAIQDFARTSKCNDDGGGWESAPGYLSLPSTTEVGFGGTDGMRFPLFSDNASRANVGINGGQGSWWLRTPESSDRVCIVNADGTQGSYYPYYGNEIGVRPISCMLEYARVYPSPNAQGQYELLF